MRISDWSSDVCSSDLLILPSKQGDIYVLDRRTGKPLTPIGTIKAPLGGVEPQERAPTQIVSQWATLRKPNLTEQDMWGMSPIDQMICRIQFRKASYKGFYTPPKATVVPLNRSEERRVGKGGVRTCSIRW